MEKLDDILSCSICQEQFKEPTIINCGHTYCASCVQKWKETSKKSTCPICRTKIIRTVPDYLTLSLIESVQAKCANKHCTWKGATSMLQAHSKICPFKENNMPKWMEEHIKKYYNNPKRKSNAPLPSPHKLRVDKSNN